MKEKPEQAGTRHFGTFQLGEPRLLRALGKPEAVALVVGSVIGSGIFFKPSQIAADVGSVPTIIAVWAVGGLLCLLGASCIAELAAMLPGAGGLYVYLREAYGKLPAFLYGWTEFWVVRPAAIGALATVLTLPLPLTETTRLSISLTVIIFLAWSNFMGVVWGGRLQDVTAIIKAGFLAVLAVLPLVLGRWEPGHFSSTLSAAPSESGLVAFGLALLGVMWAYNGWHQVTPLAEEIEDPQRNIPWALGWGIAILTTLYVGANVAYHGVLSMDQVAEQENTATAMLTQMFGPVGGAIMTALVMCSVFGAINATMLHTPRIFYAMGRDRCFFSQFGRVHASRYTPSYAIAAQTLLAVVLMLGAGLIPHGEIVQSLQSVPAGARIPAHLEGRFALRSNPESSPSIVDSSPSEGVVLVLRGTPMRWKEVVELEAVSKEEGYRVALQVLYDRSNKQVFDLLTNFVIFGASIFYVLAVLAVVLLRYRRPDLARPYQTWGYPWVPLAFTAFYVWFLSTIFMQRPWESGIGLAIIATGVPAYFLWSRRADQRGSQDS